MKLPIQLFLAISSAASAFASSNLPDLSGTARTAPAEIRPGEDIAITFNFTNTGSELTGPQPQTLLTRLELAKFSSDPSPILIEESFIATTDIIPAGTTAIQNFGGTIPASTPAGTYILRLHIDTANGVEECDESNNTVVLDPSFDVVAAPDLEFRPGVPIDISGSNLNRGAGDAIGAVAWLRNVGNRVDLPPIDVDFYLVPDIDNAGFFSFNFDPANFVFLGRGTSAPWPASAQTPGLPPLNGELPVTITSTLPADLDTLGYKIGAIIDPDNTIFERVETGDRQDSGEVITVTYIRDRPDYASGGSAFIEVSTDSVAAGGSATFSARVRNLNNFSTPNITTIRHFLKHPLFAIETPIATTLMPPVAPGGFYDFSESLQIPADTGATTSGIEYIYRFEIDSAGVVPESDESNNIAFGGPPLTVTPPSLPDLVALGSNGMFTPPSIRAGSPLTVQVTVPNAGFSNSNSFSVQFFLSANTVLGDSDDINVGTRTIPNVGAGNSATLTPTITLPNNLQPGTYRFGWKIDPGNTRTELDESNNNVFANQILTIQPPTPALRPDLTPIVFSAENSAVNFGDPITLDVTISNIGKATADRSNLSLILTRDATIGNADDFPLLTEKISEIASEASPKLRFTVDAPPPGLLPTGVYTLAAIADSSSDLDESDETNNRKLFSATPLRLREKDPDDLPKLAITSAGATPASVAPSATLEAFVNVSNQSSNAATGVTATLVLNPGSLTLADYKPVALPALSSETFRSDIILPPTVVPGTYTLTWQLDPDELIAEVDRSDNTVTQELVVRLPQFGLCIVDANPTAPLVVIKDSDPALTYQLETSTSLLPGSWLPAGTPVQGNPNSLVPFSGLSFPTSSKRFFRASW